MHTATNTKGFQTRIAATLLLIVLVTTGFAQKKKDIDALLAFPTYNEVGAHFRANYSWSTLDPNSYLNLEKRPEGWYVARFDFTLDREEPMATELIWSSENKDWVKLVHYDPGTSEKALLPDANNQWTIRQCAIHPYFNYPGWPTDVINALEPGKKLPDSLLYSLGRAYSDSANSVRDSRLKNANAVAGDRATKMSDDQARNYESLIRKSIEKFGELAARNPSFQTIVGSIGLKRANEQMHGFLDLQIYHSRDRAKALLEPGLYADFFLDYARNFLRSCPKDAILFTAGDNNTYPLLYVQEQLGFRKDVLVVNSSLLNLPEYTSFLAERGSDAEHLSALVLSGRLALEQFDYAVVDRNYDGAPKDVNSAMVYLMDDTHMVVNPNRTAGIPTWPGTVFSVPVNKQRWSSNERLSEVEIANLPSELKVKIDAPYLLRGHWMTYNIVGDNFGNRPICFDIASGRAQFFGLERYFRNRGLVYELVPVAGPVDFPIGTTNVSELHTLLMEEYRYGRVEPVDPSRAIIVWNYRDRFAALAQEYVLAGRTEDAIAVMDRCMEELPLIKVPASRAALQFAEIYYQVGRDNTASAIMISVSEQMRKYKNLGTDPLGKPLDELAWRQQMDRMVALAKRFSDNVFLNSVQDLQDQ